MIARMEISYVAIGVPDMDSKIFILNELFVAPLDSQN